MGFDILHLDTLEKTLLDAVQDRMVLNDGKILSLGQELLIDVDARAKHLGRLWAHLVHLLRHLTRSLDMSAKM